MPCEELDIVWNNIKAEARALADCEPMLASFYHATLLKHENLGSALSYMLANKLASSIMPAIAIREVVEEASTPCRLTASATGYGMKAAARWRSSCKTRFP